MFNLKGIFLKCSKKNFKILNILSCLFADLCICAYLYVLYANPTVYKKIFNELGPTLKQVNPESAKLVADVRFQTEIIQLMVQTVISIICVYLLIHLLIYLCLFFEKKFAKSYVKLYSWTGGVLMSLTGLIGIFSSSVVAMFILPGLVLAFNAQGFKFEGQMKEE